MPPTKYQIILLKGAEKRLFKFPVMVRDKIRQAISALAENPRPDGVKKLKGYGNRWRIRIGDYRVVYEIYDDRLIILVIEIDHRKDVYQ